MGKRLNKKIRKKLTVSYHLTAVRKAVSKRQDVTTTGEDVGKNEPCILLVGM